MTTQMQSAASPRDTTKTEGFPRPVGGAYRLDTLLAWEETRMEQTEAALKALVAPDREPTAPGYSLPQPKRRRQRSA